MGFFRRFSALVRLNAFSKIFVCLGTNVSAFNFLFSLFYSSTTNAVNIPLSNNTSTVPPSSQQDSNGSSISSGVGGKESSSISSFDEYLLDNNTSSSSYTKEESENLIGNHTEGLFPGILNNISPTCEVDNKEKKEQISNGKFLVFNYL